jgi:hypothetical protein
MFVLKRLRLCSELALMYLRNALAQFFRYVASCHPPVEGDTKVRCLFTKGMSSPFSYSKLSGNLGFQEKQIVRIFPPMFISRIHCCEAA